MNWYGGSIAEAVILSKSRNAVFVVFAEGTNESSQRMADAIDTESIRAELESDRFVAIRIRGDSEAYGHFVQLYKLVPLPSLFFLGDNGRPMTILTELNSTVADIEKAIREIGNAAAQPTPSENARAQAERNAQQSAEESSATQAAVRPAGASNVAPAAVRPDAPAAVRSPADAPAAVPAAVRPPVPVVQSVAPEQLVDTFVERRMRPVKPKSKPQPPPKDLEKERLEKERMAERLRTEARIQFRLPDGSVSTNDFHPSDSFRVVRDYVAGQLFSGSRNFSLASSFPRRQYTAEDDAKSLTELGLAPNAVLLILSSDPVLQRGSSGASPASTMGSAISRFKPLELVQFVFWTLVTPVITFYGYLRARIAERRDPGAQKRENEERISDNDAAKRRNLNIFQSAIVTGGNSGGAVAASKPNQGPYKRVPGVSNIHRLHEQKDPDSEDDTNTWNGNSTQQQ